MRRRQESVQKIRIGACSLVLISEVVADQKYPFPPENKKAELVVAVQTTTSKRDASCHTVTVEETGANYCARCLRFHLMAMRPLRRFLEQGEWYLRGAINRKLHQLPE